MTQRPRKQAERRPAPRRKSPEAIAKLAADKLEELIGTAPERSIALAADDGSWRVQFEVVEARRIPDTMDVLATYEVVLSGSGTLQEYHRVDRHYRGRTEVIS